MRLPFHSGIVADVQLVTGVAVAAVQSALISSVILAGQDCAADGSDAMSVFLVSELQDDQCQTAEAVPVRAALLVNVAEVVQNCVAVVDALVKSAVLANVTQDECAVLAASVRPAAVVNIIPHRAAADEAVRSAVLVYTRQVDPYHVAVGAALATGLDAKLI